MAIQKFLFIVAGVGLPLATTLCAATPSLPNEIQRELENYWDNGFPAAHASFIAANGDSATELGAVVQQPKTWIIERGDAWVWASPALANVCPPDSPASEKCGRTSPETFAKLSGIKPGDPVSLAQIPRAERLLLRQGYFSKNSPTRLYRIENRNRLVPVFDFNDVSSNSAEAAFAYDAENKETNGYVKVNLRNIAGTARDFSISAFRASSSANTETNSKQNSAEIYYKEPFLFSSNSSLALRYEFLEIDLYQQNSASLIYSQNLNWEWQYSVGGGFKNSIEYDAENRKSSTRYFSSIGLSYDNRDKLPLPFSGLFLKTQAEFSSDEEFSKFISGGLSGGFLQPISKNWTILLCSQGYGIFSGIFSKSEPDYGRADLFALGGQDNFRSLPPNSIYSRAFGISETDFQWHGFSNSVLHLFSQLGAYRLQPPFHGWKRIFAYGFGWEQGISSASIAIFYTLAQNTAPLDGLLNLSVRMWF